MSSPAHDKDKPKKAGSVQIRYIIVLMTTLCPLVCYMSRQNLSLAIVAMVDNKEANATHIQLSGKSIDIPDACPLPVDHNGKSVLPKSYGPKYDWTPSQKSLLFEAFFLPYVIFQIPSARLAEIIGAKWILMTAAVGSAIISFFAPWAASIHPYALAALRALMGICQTALFPAGYVLYTKWLTPAERSRAITFIGSGAYIGAIIISTLTGYFNEQPELGWEYAFYIPGIVCTVWALIWAILCTSDPKEHRLISAEELEYIESSNSAAKSATSSKAGISWIKILTSQHIVILVIGFFVADWAFTIAFTHIPSYLNYIHKVPHFKNGIINSVIYILNAICSPLVGFISTRMVEKHSFGLTSLQVRKLFQGTAIFGQGACFFILPLIECNTTLVLVVLFSQIILLSFGKGGIVQMPAELSLEFAGTIYAIGNCIGSSSGFIVPRVHSLMVTNISSRASWNSYYYLSSFIISIGGILFVTLAKNDQQDFSKRGKYKTVEKGSFTT